MPTVEDLGKLVKAKHSEYASLSDIEVGQKTKAKYPEYSHFDDITPAPTGPITPKPPIDLNLGVPDRPTGGSVSRATSMGQSAPVPELSQDPVGGTAQLAKPLSIPAALAVARVTPGPPLVKALSGAASYTGIYSALQHAAGEAPSTEDAAKDLFINETLSKVGGAIASKGKAFYNAYVKGIRPDPLLDKLGATAAQRTGSDTLKFVEDTFASKKKQAALDASGKAARQLGSETAADFTKTTPEVIADPAARANLFNKSVNENYRKSELTSNTLGNVARMRAQLHPVEVTTGYAPSDIIDPTTGKPAMNPVTAQVEGPIPVDEVYGWANDTLKKYPDPNLLVDPDQKKAYLLAHNIIQKTAVLDEKGIQVATRPLGFGDTWDFKQEADKEYGNRAFNGLADAFNKDIETGITQWNNGQGDPLALKAFRESKKEVARRISTFNDDKSIAALLQSNDSTTDIKQVDNLLKDPHRLQRFFTTQSGGGNGNVRKLAQGADLAIVLDNSFSPSDQKFNGKTLIDNWLDPNHAAARKLIYGDEGVKNVSNVLNAIKEVSTPEGSIGKTATKFRIINSAIQFGPSLLAGTAFASGHGLTSAAILGATVPLSALAKLSVSKTYAPIVAAMIKGAPLGMSEQLANRLIMQGLIGSKIQVMLDGGKKRDGVITKDGIDISGAKK